MCVNGKMISIETVPGKGMKENDGRGEFKYDLYDIVRTLVNATMYPHPAQQ
jgi:hypothetical protein